MSQLPPPSLSNLLPGSHSHHAVDLSQKDGSQAVTQTVPPIGSLFGVKELVEARTSLSCLLCTAGAPRDPKAGELRSYSMLASTILNELDTPHTPQPSPTAPMSLTLPRPLSKAAATD